jgi:hypothetical protein
MSNLNSKMGHDLSPPKNIFYRLVDYIYIYIYIWGANERETERERARE